MVDLEEKLDSGGGEKDGCGVEEKWYNSHNGINPEAEYASKQVGAHSRPTLWR